MLSVTQLDYNNYWRAFKGNYAKGIRILANILQTPQQANDLTSNLGGVSVLLGTPVGSEDVNSETLRTMLLESAYADNAVNTWLGGFYTFDDLGTLFADQTVRAEVFTSPLLWRAVSAGSVAMTKYVTNIVGLNPNDYADMQAVAASSTAMAAVAASSTAMTAVVASSTAMEVLYASPTAVAAIWQSSTAIGIVQSNEDAWASFTGVSSEVIGKTVAILAGLNPDDYADMQAVAASSTAMAAVAASSTAMTAVAASPSATEAIVNSETAIAAIMPDLESNPHMQPLYYYGEQYKDLTGGYVASASNQIKAYIRSEYLEINSSAGTSGGGSIAGINFAKIGSGYTGFAVRYKRIATAYTNNTSISTSAGSTVSIEFPKVAKDDFVLKTDESMASWEDFKASVGYDNTCYFYAICLVKPDDIAPISSLAGITASSIADVLTNSAQVFKQGAAVWYIIKNCTGDFAVQAVKNSTFMDALNASPMKSIFTAHSLWQKYLKMAV